MKLFLPKGLLRKSWSRGPRAGYKYIKKTPYFSGGKLRWRYYYADDITRERWRHVEDPNQEHEHKLVSEISSDYENLKANIVSVLEITADKLKSMFGFKKPPAVVIGHGFQSSHVTPAIQEEQMGKPPTRAPMERVNRALDRIPAHLKDLVDPEAHEGKKYVGLKEFALNNVSDDEYASTDNILGWAERTTGKLHIISGSFKSPMGEARYGSPLTLAEEVIWHEFGHHVHYALENDNKFESFTRLPGEKITPYAHTNSYEDFAESFACMISHPQQLARTCPERYEWFKDELFPEMPEIKEILQKPPEEYAWWDSAKVTSATKLLNVLKFADKAPAFHDYHSDNDQFFKVSRGGRSVYIRFGPAAKSEEDGWEKVPDTVDTLEVPGPDGKPLVVQIPKFEHYLGPRFKKTDSIKEIYDDNGSPLTDKQAFFYLGQNDDKVIAAAESGGEVEAYSDWLAGKGTEPAPPAEAMEADSEAPKAGGKKADTHLLSYKLYTSLGWKEGDSQESEKARIAKIIERQRKWDAVNAKSPDARTAAEKKLVESERPDFTLERHTWAPLPVAKPEFISKTGTFKLGDLKSAEKQPWTALQNGKPILRYDDKLGKDVPVLSGRVYEQENPDGSFSRVLVNESSPFHDGDDILVPTAAGWRKETLKRGDPLDPFELARKYETTAAAILEKNKKFGRWQITDNILSSLVNPNQIPITDESVLQDLMRRAALDTKVNPSTGAVEGRRTWAVSHGPTINHAVAHLQVEFDAKGPPKVVGNYWPRVVGKADPRLDDVINEKNTLDLPKIVEHAPTKKDAPAILDTVFFTDPRSGKRLHGTLLERKTVDGKPAYNVQPTPGQAAGASTTVVAVDSVESVSSAFLPNKPGFRRRNVEALEKHMLVYLDEVPEKSGPYDTDGVIKIKLPKDGSVTYEELLRNAMVTRSPGGDILVDIHEIPKLRENIGGFMMDSRMAAKLSETDRITREMEESAGKKHVVEASELEDEEGNINPNGPLGKMVTGPDGIQPGPHRIRALQKLARTGRLYAAHFMGTGKSALAIMAAEMMRNIKDPSDKSKPHPKQTKKKTLVVVPLNTAENWRQEFVRFSSTPTVIGASTLAGAQQLPKLPPRDEGESDADFRDRSLASWKEQVKASPKLWNPWNDASKDVVIPFEYFRDNEEILRMAGLFDGLVVDEAHKIANENQTSKAVERWAPSMNLFMLMSGTPIMNTLDTLPRITELVTGQALLGNSETFKERYLVPSAVLREEGRKNPPRTDINPQLLGQLVGVMNTFMDVATTADVKGKSMPAVLLDENEPAHMIGQQARMYRAAIAALTEEERAALESSGAFGLDEQHMLSEEARQKVAVARSIANCPAYKAPDASEDATYTAEVAIKDKKGTRIVTQTRTFTMPTLKVMTAKRPSGWDGRWPSLADVESGVVQSGYYTALKAHAHSMLGVNYDAVEGMPIDPELLAKVKEGHTTPAGDHWGADGGKVKNQDYGPEGMACRGILNPTTKEIEPIKGTWFNPETDTEEPLTIPVGLRFIRDPNAKAAGLFYHEDDWNFVGRFSDSGETGDDPGGADDGDSPEKRKAQQQGPKPGHENKTIQRSPERRRERRMFDIVTTTGSAKADKLEALMRNIFNDASGSGSRSQLIVFGNRIGSSCRAAESKMRTMGYMDVNEALGNPEWSSAADKKQGLRTRKFFVSYMGKGATLGDRDINSEIFRRQQDEFGKDTGVSMFVWKSLYGEGRNPPKAGEIREGWGRSHRDKIAACFVDAFKQRDDGTPVGMEVPMRVMGQERPDGAVGQVYLYESSMKPKDRSRVKELEILAKGARGAALADIEKQMAAVFKPYWTDRKPLTDAQIDIFNNCQVMVASDAANVGLNWPCENLVMYDSLFSPMAEWQRITRAARMLPPAIRGKAKPLINKIGAYIDDLEKQNGFKEYEGMDSAMLIVREAIEKTLTDNEKGILGSLPGGSVDQIAEAWFAQRAFDKIATLRETVGAKLREVGVTPDPSKPTGKGNFIPAKSIQESDVINEIIQNHLTPFDREVLKSRRYLVDVKRLTVSVDMPEFRQVRIKTEEGIRTVNIPTGNFTVESPVQAERSQLAQQRAKMVPYEQFLKHVQNAQPLKSKYSFLPEASGSFSIFSNLDSPSKPKPEAAKKSIQFFIPMRKPRGFSLPN